jgi:hypothetical protein
MTFIKGIAGAAAIVAGLSASAAQAGYVVDLTQQGGDVIATGSGAIDLSGLTFAGFDAPHALLEPSIGAVATGPTGFLSPVFTTVYASVSGPASFGSGSRTLAFSGSGDFVSLNSFFHELEVPKGYVSDSPLSDTSTYNEQSFSTLGVTPGRYEWTWGTGANQNFTLVIGTAIPEPSTWAMMLIGFAGLGLTGYRSAGRRATLRRSGSDAKRSASSTLSGPIRPER